MKKIFYLIILLFIPFYVYADSCDLSKIKIEAVSVSNNNGEVVETESTTQENNINFNLKMSKPGDSITYRIVIKNESKEDLEIDKSNIKGSEYINYSFYNDEDIFLVKANSIRNIFLKIEYKNEVPGEQYTENQNITLSLSGLTNPKTGIFNYSLLLGIIMVGGVVFLISTKNKNIKTYILLLLILTPIISYATCKYDIKINSSITISKIAEFDTGEVFYQKIRDIAGDGVIKTFKRSNTLPSEIKTLVDNQFNTFNNYSLSDEELNDYYSSFHEYARTFNGFFIKEADGATNYCVVYSENEHCFPKDEMINILTSNFAIIIKENNQTKYLIYDEENKEIKTIEDEETLKELMKKYIVTKFKSQIPDNVLSSKSSNYLIYGWYDSSDSSIKYYCEKDIIYLNRDSSYMFSYLQDLNDISEVNNFNTSNVIDMSSMFSGDVIIESIDLSNFDTSNVTDMRDMFSALENVNTLDLRNFDTSKVKNMSYMFNDMINLKSINLSNFDTSSVESMEGMFFKCENLTSLNVSNFNTSKVKNMSHMFAGANKLESIDVSNFNTSNVIDMSYMFQDCFAITSLDLRNFDTSKVTTMAWMIADCINLTDLKIDNFNTSNVTNMAMMFSGSQNLTSLDLSHFNTSNVENMRYMFCNNYELASLNISSFDTSKVTDMGWMFYGLRSLNSLDLRNFDTSNVKIMSNMFAESINLESINLSSFRTPELTDMRRMFGDCKNLKSLDLSNFDTSNVRTMYMLFNGCLNLSTINLSSFNTSNVTDMGYMFYGMPKLESLDLSSFDTRNVNSMNKMFNSNRNLEHIYVSEKWTTEALTEEGGKELFRLCTKLPNYNGNYVDKSKAHYGEGGYLTYKAN